GDLRNFKTANARTVPETFAGSKADRKCFVDCWCWEGICGTLKQQMPGQYQKHLLGAKRTGDVS
ncbi:MAG: hypothetical protein K2N63_03460, partial [Lachnospiraceae bacterium]|nr:hypothetical protein [Lachnospiraceae bacterium]